MRIGARMVTVSRFIGQNAATVRMGKGNKEEPIPGTGNGIVLDNANPRKKRGAEPRVKSLRRVLQLVASVVED